MSESATEEKTRTIETPEGSFTIRLTMDDMGSVYPGMIRYNIEVLRGTETVYTYAINSYEIPPGSLFDARKAAEIVFARLAEDVSSRPHLYLRPRVFTRPLPGDTVDVVIRRGVPAGSATPQRLRPGAMMRPQGQVSPPVSSTCRIWIYGRA